MNIDKIFNNIEKIFRYLVPAFAFCVLLKYFDNDFYRLHINKLPGPQFSFAFLLGGMTIYSIHRIIFEVIDIAVFKCNNESLLDHCVRAIKLESQKLDSLYYKMGTIHSVLIIMELLAIFLVFNWKPVYFCPLLITSSFFIYGVCVYWKYNRLHIDIIKQLEEDERTSTISLPTEIGSEEE